MNEVVVLAPERILEATEESWDRVLATNLKGPFFLTQRVANEMLARKGHLRDPASFALPYPVPSVSRREPAFMPGNARGFIWRGPTWINTNWLLGEGLRAHGVEDLRAALLDATCALVERSGFREYYNPFTAEGYGARDFTWSGLLLDME